MSGPHQHRFAVKDLAKAVTVLSCGMGSLRVGLAFGWMTAAVAGWMAAGVGVGWLCGLVLAGRRGVALGSLLGWLLTALAALSYVIARDSVALF